MKTSLKYVLVGCLVVRAAAVGAAASEQKAPEEHGAAADSSPETPAAHDAPAASSHGTQVANKEKKAPAVGHGVAWGYAGATGPERWASLSRDYETCGKGAMPQKAGPARKIKQTLINARDLLPHDTGYYRYMGSLTTPPCSEGVNWFVMRQPVSVSMAQIERFADAVGSNARPVQAINRRFVLAPLAGQ